MKPFPGYRPSHPINNEASLSLIAKKYMYSNLRGVRKLFEQTYLKCLEQSLLFSLGDHSCPPRPGAGFLWIRQKLVQALPNCGSFGHLCRTMPSPARTLHCPWAHNAGIFYTKTLIFPSNSHLLSDLLLWKCRSLQNYPV